MCESWENNDSKLNNYKNNFDKHKMLVMSLQK